MKARKARIAKTLSAATIATVMFVFAGQATAVTGSESFVAMRGAGVAGPVGLLGSFGMSFLAISDGGSATVDTTTGITAAVVPPVGFIMVATPLGFDFGMGPLPGWSYSVDPLLLIGSYSFTVASAVFPAGTLTASITASGTGPYFPGAGIGPYFDPTPTVSIFGAAGVSRSAVSTGGSIVSSTMGGGALAAGSPGGFFEGATGGFTITA